MKFYKLQDLKTRKHVLNGLNTTYICVAARRLGGWEGDAMCGCTKWECEQDWPETRVKAVFVARSVLCFRLGSRDWPIEARISVTIVSLKNAWKTERWLAVSGKTILMLSMKPCGTIMVMFYRQEYKDVVPVWDIPLWRSYDRFILTLEFAILMGRHHHIGTESTLMNEWPQNRNELLLLRFYPTISSWCDY